MDVEAEADAALCRVASVMLTSNSASCIPGGLVSGNVLWMIGERCKSNSATMNNINPNPNHKINIIKQ